MKQKGRFSHLLFNNSLGIVNMHRLIDDITLQKGPQSLRAPFYRSENRGTDSFSNDVRPRMESLPKSAVPSSPSHGPNHLLHMHRKAKQQSHGGEKDPWIYSVITSVGHAFVPAKMGSK